MTRDFLLPDLGEGLTEAEIITWLVAVGDTVTVDQIVVEVETAKAAVEVPCPFAGVVTSLHGGVGDVVDVGKPLISIGASTDGTSDGGQDNWPQAGDITEAPEEPADRARLDAAKKATANPAERSTAKSGGSGNVLIGYGTPDSEGSGRRRRRVVSGFGGHTAPSAEHVRTRASSAAEPVAIRSASGAAVPTPVRRPHLAVVSPLVRRLAREQGLDLSTLRGTGPDGLILRRDVEGALAAPASAATAAQTTTSAPQTKPSVTATDAATATGNATESERIPLRGVRKAVAEKLSRSRREIPDATTWVDVDATRLVELRDTLNSGNPSQRIGLLALFARITIAGLTRHPELNATVDTEHQEIVRLKDVNLGFAAQTDRGLVVPVIHGANHLSTEQLAAEFERLTSAARSGTLSVADLTGSTFTLNNYGVYGVDGSTPIINHPEAGMLGIGRIIKKPWVLSGPNGDELTIRKVTQLSFTFDHRVCDGGVAGGFLRHVADLAEEPSRLLRSV